MSRAASGGALAADEPDDGGGAPRGARGPRSLLDGRLTVDAGVRLEDVAAAVRTSVLKLASTWDDRFEALKKFAERTGRANPSRRDVDGDSGLDLHRWAARQKRAHRRGHLSRDRVDRLESIGFDFHVRGSDAAFRRALELYKDPPADPRAWYRCRDWLRRQRQLYHAGELAEHRRALLEDAGVDWGSGPRGPPPDVAKADDRAADLVFAECARRRVQKAKAVTADRDVTWAPYYDPSKPPRRRFGVSPLLVGALGVVAKLRFGL